MEEKTGKDKKKARRIGHGEERGAGQVNHRNYQSRNWKSLG